MLYNNNRRIESNGTNFKKSIDNLSVYERFKFITEKTPIDLKGKGIIKFYGLGLNTNKKASTTDDEVNINFTNQFMKNVIGNEKIQTKDDTKFHITKQSGNKSGTSYSVKKTWDNLEKFKKDTKNEHHLYVFDTETIGGTTFEGHRWTPQVITEFAMQDYNFATQETIQTNILMANDVTIEAMEKQLNDIETILSKPNGIEELKKHNDLYVTASRLSLYDETRGARFEFNKENVYMEATKLLDTSEAMPGNINSIKQGFKSFKNAHEEVKKFVNEENGLTGDTIAFLQAVGKMNKAMQDETGIVAGHNIIDFDRPVVDSYIQKIIQKQEDLIANGETEKIRKQAEQALKDIDKMLGGAHFDFKQGYVLDTMVGTKIVRDEAGVNKIYKGSKEEEEIKFFNEINEYGKTAGLETIANAYYKEESKEGTAHLAAFDTLQNLRIIMSGSEELEGKSYMEHIMQYMPNDKGLELNDKQIFKAVNNFGSTQYTGKKALNFVSYKDGEQIFTNAGISLKGEEVTHTDFAGNTGFSRNQYYKFSKSSVIEYDALPKDMQKEIFEHFPEYSAGKLYTVEFESVHVVSGLDHTVTMIATSQDEIEGIISSNLRHVADAIEENGEIEDYKIVRGAGEYLRTAALDSEKEELHINKLKGKTGKERLFNAIERNDRTVLSDRSRRMLDVKRVNDVLEINKQLKKSGIEDLERLAKDDALLNILDGKIPSNFTEKEANQIKEIVKDVAGYIPKGKTEKTIDFRTEKKIGYVYNNIVDRGEYYTKILNQVKNDYGIEGDFGKWWYENKNKQKMVSDTFTDLDTRVRMAISQEMEIKGGSSEFDPIRVKNRAFERKNVTLANEYQFKNTYDFVLGKKFKSIGGRGTTIDNLKSNLPNEEDIVTLRLGSSNPTLNFSNQLLDLYLGDKDRSNRTPEDLLAKRRQAVYNFFVDLDDNRRDNRLLFEDGELAKAIEKMRENPAGTKEYEESFNIDQMLGLLLNKAEEAKKKNRATGIKKPIGSSYDVNDFRKDFMGKLNKIDVKRVQKEAGQLSTRINLKEVGKNKKSNLENMVDLMSKYYVMSAEELEKKIETMPIDDSQKTVLKFMRDDFEKKTKARLTDVIKANNTTRFDLSFDRETGQLIMEKNGKAEVLDSFLRLNMSDTGVMYAETATTKYVVNAKIKAGKDGTFLSTNIDENYGATDYFQRVIKNKEKTGQPIHLTDFNHRMRVDTKETKETALFTDIMSDQMYRNYLVDASDALDKIPNRLFNKDSIDSLNHLIPDNKEWISGDVEGMFRKYGYKLENNMPAELLQFGIADMIDILGMTADTENENYETFKEVLSNLNVGTKDVTISHGIFKLGERTIATYGNLFDNVARPPMYGGGNIFYIDKKKLEAVSGKDGVGLILSNSVIESEKTLSKINRETIEGKLTSQFTYRQGFMSQPMIKKKMAENKEDIIANKLNINNATIQQMDEQAISKVYDKVAETAASGTHEQARIVDARMFKDIINMPVNTQYLSNNKDIVNGLNVNRDEDMKMLENLTSLMGTIKVGKDGKISYKRTDGTLISKGEIAAKYEGFGGINSAFGPKMRNGVLSYSVRGSNDIELTEETINTLLNTKTAQEAFSKAENDAERLKVFHQIMKDNNIKTAFKIENVNEASLPKLLSGGSEKGMSFALLSSVGELNKTNKEMFEKLHTLAKDFGLEGEAYDFVGSKIVATDNAVRALFSDIRNKGNEEMQRFNETAMQLSKDKDIDFSDIVSAIKRSKTIDDANKELINLTGNKDAGILQQYFMDEDVKKYSKILRYTNHSNKITTEKIMRELSNDRLKFDDLLKSVKDEQMAKSELIFGKYGAFSGVLSLANDNIPKHENEGLGALGAFSEAVALYGQALDKDHKMNNESYNKALNNVVDLINNNEKYNFLAETRNKSANDSVAKKLSIIDGTIVVNKNQSLSESDILDQNKLNNLFEEINSKIEEADKINGRVTNEEDKLIHRNVLVSDEKGGYKTADKLVGSFYFDKDKDGNLMAIGSKSMMYTSVIRDGETASGITQDYIDAVKNINLLEARKDELSSEERDALRKLQNKRSATKDSVKFMRLDDQAVAVLQQDYLNDKKIKELNAEMEKEDGLVNKEKAKLIEGLTHEKIKYENGSFAISEDIKSDKPAYEKWIKSVKDSRFYDEFSSTEKLTAERAKELGLEDIYDSIVTQGRAPALGLEQAQDLKLLKSIDTGARWNNNMGISMDEMIDKHGYKIMDIQQFVSAEGTAQTEAINDILEQNVLIDLGEHMGNGNERYIAIPAGGSVVGTEQIRRDWQRAVQTLKINDDNLRQMEGAGMLPEHYYKDWANKTQTERKKILEEFNINEADVENRIRYMTNMRDTANSITKMIDAYPRKDTLFTDYSKAKIYSPQARLKLTSVTGDYIADDFFKGSKLEGKVVKDVSKDAQNFMNTASILMSDGTSKTLNQLEKEGIFYDYKGVGKEIFEDMNLLDDKHLNALGVRTREEALDYYSKYGTVTMDTRFPQIKEGSLYMGRMFYDPTLNGSNQVRSSISSLVKEKGDSDGDSVSFALVQAKRLQNIKIAGEELERSIPIDMSMYEAEKARLLSNEAWMDENKRRMSVGEQQIGSRAEYNKFVENKLAAHYGEDNVNMFETIRTNMAVTAATTNVEYAKEAMSTQLKDIKTTTMSSAISSEVDGEVEQLIHTFKGAKSDTFANRKYSPINFQPTGSEIKSNMQEVDKYIVDAFQANPGAFSDKNALLAKDIAEGKLDIHKIKGNNKYSIIDEAMMHFENTLDKSDQAQNELFSKVQSAFTNRVQYSQYFEEATAKGGKGAIASINTSLYALKTAIKATYGNASSEHFNPDLSSLMSRFAYQLEEQVISSKKVAYEVGDTRLIDVQDLLGKVKKGNVNTEVKQGIADWLTTYTDEGVTNNIWQGMSTQYKRDHNMDQRLANTINRLKSESKDFKMGLIGEAEIETAAKNHIISTDVIDTMSTIANKNNVEGQDLIKVLSLLGRQGSNVSGIGEDLKISDKIMNAEVMNIIRENPKETASKVDEVMSNSSTAAFTSEMADRLAEKASDAFKEELSSTGGGGGHIGGLGWTTLGLASAVLVAGFAGGGHSKPARADKQQQEETPPDFSEQYESGQPVQMPSKGYVINMRADTSKGQRHFNKMIKQAVKSTAGNDVNINMTYRTTKGGGYSNKDIERFINNI